MNIYESWTRKPELDTPRLVSGCNGYENAAILPQIGFTTPEGTDIQISYQRAREWGLVDTMVIPTITMDAWISQPR